MFKFSSIKCFSGACCKINVRLAGDFNAISSLKQFLLQLKLHALGQPKPALQAGARVAQPGRHESWRGDRGKDEQAGAAQDAQRAVPEQKHQRALQRTRHGRLHLPPGNNQRATESYGFD